jgi:hypothetical protein
MPEDEALGRESRSHVASHGALQLMAELILKLRGARFPWWTPELLRGTWDAHARMAWFRQRADIRQRITCSLTGLRPKAARNKRPEFQADLIDSVIDDGDMTVDQFEDSFDAIELAAYAPVAEIWHGFRSRMPWDQDLPPNQELVGWLIERLLASSSTIEGMTRTPILTPHAIRATIPGAIWHSTIPLEIRVTIDELRLEQERARPGEPFHAIHELSVATPTIIAASIPLRELTCILDVAERAMGLPASQGSTAAALPTGLEEAARARAEIWDVTSRPLVAPAQKMRSAAPPAEEPQPGAAAAEKARPAAHIGEKAQAAMPPAEKARPAAPPAGKAAERAAEKPVEKPMDKWERMANRVLEKIGKEGGNAEEPWGTNR